MDRDALLPALRALRGFALEEELNMAFVSGECVSPDSADAQAGAGVWFGRGDNRNQAGLPDPIISLCSDTGTEDGSVQESDNRNHGTTTN